MIPFPEAFLAFITTQSEEEPVGVMLSELTKARAIRDGKVDGAMLPVLYEFPESVQSDVEAWKDSSLWPMVTPNVGRSITIDRLEEGLREAELSGEAELRAWASQHLNIQIGLSLKTDAWAGALFWESCATQLTLDEVIRRSEVIVAGVDGGGLDDMLGLAVLGREASTGAWLLWTHAWIHPIVLKRRKKEAERFRDFERQGDLTIVEKIGDDVEGVADVVERIDREGLLDRIGVDKAGIGAVVDAIVRRHIEIERIVGISQGWHMVGAIKTTERKLAEGTLLHGSQPLMSWNVGNAKPEARGNAVLITKQGSGSAKIDPLMATFDAVTLMALNPEARRKTYDIHFI
jgi:phage terminase large subunit-like protein